jgi:TRAP-type C4-dicarboxylate transport system substrate-binding protein
MLVGRLGIWMLFAAITAGVPASAQEVTLRAVSAFAEKTQFSRNFERFIERVNAQGKGVVKINYIGGPRAVPPLRSAMRCAPASSTWRT